MSDLSDMQDEYNMNLDRFSESEITMWREMNATLEQENRKLIQATRQMEKEINRHQRRVNVLSDELGRRESKQPRVGMRWLSRGFMMYSRKRLKAWGNK